jgi:hypothetical protein
MTSEFPITICLYLRINMKSSLLCIGYGQAYYIDLGWHPMVYALLQMISC